jgi:hypothetical protein
MKLLAVLPLLTVLVAGSPVGAHAADMSVTFKSDTDFRQGKSQPAQIPHSQQPGFTRRPVAPVVVVAQPVYFAAPQRCVVQGYWAYAWVPQSYAENVWVPSYYNYDAVWVEGHYESRSYTGGYYQPYWVPERAC